MSGVSSQIIIDEVLDGGVYSFDPKRYYEVIETLQWLKGMNIDGLSLIEETFNE